MSFDTAFLGLEVDDCDPITNPFYYAQDVDAYLADERNLEREIKNLKTESDNVEKKQSKPMKKKANLSLKKRNSVLSTHEESPVAATSTASYVLKKHKKGEYLIKLNIYDLRSDTVECEPPKNIISVQYVVEHKYDEIMYAADNLVDKIVKKLHDS